MDFFKTMNDINKIRHPQFKNTPERPSGRKPNWIRVKAPVSKGYRETKSLMKDLNLTTVCEEAACPNIGECWEQKHATVMILGDTCTRACAFCNVITGKPDKINLSEPENIAKMVATANLKHLVITSVDRDDLPDGGAEHFARCIKEVKSKSPNTTIEVLTPDFKNKIGALEIVVDANPDVFNHNLETVPRLYKNIRPGSRYYHSLRLLEKVKELNPGIFTKSGIMVGLGESKEEVIQVMDDQKSAKIDFLTIGQYLQPTVHHATVERYVNPDEFSEYEQIAYSKGFLMVSSSPLTRSSYHADKDFEMLKEKRMNLLKSA